MPDAPTPRSTAMEVGLVTHPPVGTPSVAKVSSRVRDGHLDPTQRRRLLIIAGLALVAIVAFLTLDVQGQWAFALPRRTRKVIAMVAIAHAIATSTVLFQTVTTNRILTPSIMGFDALYMALQTVGVFFLGAAGVVHMPDQLRFGIEIVAMIAFAAALYRLLFGGSRRDLHVLVLAGLVCGTLFRSATSLIQRLIDPNEFQILQDLYFASFNAIDMDLLVVSVAILGAVSVVAWRMRATLDVLALGREHAINLGLDHPRLVRRVLVIIAIMVSVSTALVGPITFFGLLVANLAYEVMRTHRHHVVLPAATLLGVVALVGGQLVLERFFGFDTSLSIIVNFIGGLWFIRVLLRQARL